MGRNTVGKGEIAHYEQFLLFPQCFQKVCFPGESKGVNVWEWVKECIYSLPNDKSLDYTKFKFVENGRNLSIRVENTVGKGEIAHNEQFLLFQPCFLKTCAADLNNQGLFGKG